MENTSQCGFLMNEDFLRIGWISSSHPSIRLSVVFIPSEPAPLVAPRNIAPAGATSLRPPSLSC